MNSPLPAYAELHARSNFSFRRGASHPGELVRRAAELGYRALAITDECSMAGIVRAWEAARECRLRLIVGSELRTVDGLHLVLLAPDQAAYGRICSLITRARRRAEKGSYRLERGDLESGLDGVLAIWKPTDPPRDADAEWLKRRFGERLRIGATRLLQPGETAFFDSLDKLSRRFSIPCTACGDVVMHRRSRRALADVLRALDIGRPLAECGLALAANGERHLRPLSTLQRLYPAEWLAESARLAERCTFDPGSLQYRYPAELVPRPYTPSRWLRHLTLEGMHARFPDGVPEETRKLIARELDLIEQMGVEAFFLTVHDVVRFARSRGILCQGRGSAANSAVCYCLHITEVDPARQQLLFERFISRERDEPPDIDVDFEHERREEVLQYIYAKYGRERAALAATVICYRPKSALKDVGRALGLDPQRMNRLTGSLSWWDDPEAWPERLRQCGFDPHGETARRLLALTSELIGFPRHLSQHVGGMVIADEPLHRLVPVENAAMEDRTIIQWDKDDLETLGLLKVDCLALGMLTALRKSMELVNRGDSREDPDPCGFDQEVNGEWKIVNRKRPAEAVTPSASGQVAVVRESSAPWNPQGPGVGYGAKGSRAFTIHDSLFTIHEEQSDIPDTNGRLRAESNAPTPLTLATIPREDPATYEMLSRGDAVGVFQVESRAQMAMLPRLKPRCFQDLVVEVAIVRPGPIQGDMVHPYLERREHPERVDYPSEPLKKVLERTLGVPIFQEQVMQIAIVAAGFTPGEADQLRRAMAAWKRRGGLEPFRDKLVDGMRARGYSADFAERIYGQICGFGDYGFPESHAASFALLTYFSAWMKRHHPAAFTCGLLNSQPMGFYAPAQLVNDARRHGVRVLPVDVRYSAWDCDLEPMRPTPGERDPARSFVNRESEIVNGKTSRRIDSADSSIHDSRFTIHGISAPAIRLGLRMVAGMGRDASERLVEARAKAAFRDVQDVVERARLDRKSLHAMTEAGALKALSGHRRRARWEALAARRQGDLLSESRVPEHRPALPLPSRRDELRADFASTGMSLEDHPLALLRRRLGPGVLTARGLRDVADGRAVQAAGLVTHRQRPGTASGVIFLSLEDETGIVNVIVWPKLAERWRAEVLGAGLLRVRGKLQNARGSQHVVASGFESLDGWLDGLQTESRDFH
ncbi:MAG: error-prone DNA polymerase [Candidatus Wenzhouxiangella sp. M2_3B_020]